MRNYLTIFCLLSIVVFSCGKSKRASGPGVNMAGNNARQFSVISLTSRSVTVHNDFPATLQGQRVIEIRPMVSGYLKDMHVKEGQRVVKGQLLFTINNPQFEQDVITAKAKISSATADLNTARMEIEKVKTIS